MSFRIEVSDDSLIRRDRNVSCVIRGLFNPELGLRRAARSDSN